MKLFGIEFAPLWIPLERRLQTIAVFYYCTSFLLVGIVGVAICILLLFTKFYFITLLYLAWFAYDRNICNEGGRRCNWIRSWRLWYYFRDYYPIKMIKTAELDPQKNYILGYHPHGILCAGAFCCFATEGTNFSKVYPGIVPHLLTLEGQFWFPFHREHLMFSGACAATKHGIEWLLTKKGTGNALILVVGGAAESLDAHPGTASLILKRRKGFIKLALKHGTSLVPVFAFGENDIFTQLENPHGSLIRRIQDWLTKLCGVAPPIVHGRGIFQYNMGMLPYRKPITVIIGKPIDIVKIPEPTHEDVQHAHQLYVDSLIDLFEEYKDKYGPNIQLKI